MAKWVRLVVTVAAILALYAVSALAEARVLVNTDFANSKYNVTFKSTDAKHITGKLPASWSDNSDWNAEIDLTYTPTTEEGVTFLRMEKDTAGRAQLMGNITKKTPAGTYKFTMVCKAGTAVTPEIGVRLTGEPYTFVWSTHPALDDSWTTIEEEVVFDEAVKNVGIYICFDAATALDVKSVKFEEE